MSERMCDVCGKATAGKGFVGVNARQAVVRLASWVYAHLDCLPPVVDYCISEYDLRTPRQVEDWRALLAQKRWFVNTDWDGLLRRLGLNKGADYRPAKGGNG